VPQANNPRRKNTPDLLDVVERDLATRTPREPVPGRWNRLHRRTPRPQLLKNPRRVRRNLYFGGSAIACGALGEQLNLVPGTISVGTMAWVRSENRDARPALRSPDASPPRDV